MSTSKADVPCSGPCRKRFRPETVNMNEAAANALLTSDAAESGLFWFCPECRCQLRLVFPRPAPVDHSEFYLPPELWLMIFQMLDEQSLLQVRLTCPRWKRIVDQNRSLREAFTVQIKGAVLDGGNEPQHLYPASRAFLDDSRIISVDSWWPSFGARLTVLDLFNCEVALPNLLGLLRQTPNLTNLILEHIRYTSVEETISADFRLEKMQCLSSETVFEVFGHIFPRLSEFTKNFPHEEGEDVKMCQFLRPIQCYIQNLTCPLTSTMVDQMAEMSELYLNSVDNRSEDDSSVKLSRIQPSIEKLTTISTDANLCEIGSNLKYLKYIAVFVPQSSDDFAFVPSFLTKMKMLKGLTLIACKGHRLDFGGFKSPSLRGSKLVDCSLSNWTDLFATKWSSLRCLKLFKIDAPQTELKPNLKPIPYLNELNISNCNIPAEMLKQLVERCPSLTSLELGEMDTVVDNIVYSLVLLPQLKKLTIYSCPFITDCFVGVLVIRNPRWHVNIEDCLQISEAARKRLGQLGH
ncbi:hypothetical protein pipiens_009345 [Culex pipiens pipiens]|uniref:F-box domain-containing protein n=1 Tax=Culex pipiens pipiens TaxID=38569 RepID=A0ABD1DE59_CULPP